MTQSFSVQLANSQLIFLVAIKESVLVFELLKCITTFKKVKCIWYNNNNHLNNKKKMN